VIEISELVRVLDKEIREGLTYLEPAQRGLHRGLHHKTTQALGLWKRNAPNDRSAYSVSWAVCLVKITVGKVGSVK